MADDIKSGPMTDSNRERRRILDARDAEHQELLDARDVVEAADDFLTISATKLGLPRTLAMAELEAANRRYWEKWGEKK